jgi:AraC-like DNA-binding protein
MNDKLILIISASAVLNLSLITILSWVKSKDKPANFWLGWMFFASCVAILDNTFIFADRGTILLYHLGLFSNLSFGGLLITFVDSFLHYDRKTIKFNWLLFIPTFTYVPFIILCFIQPYWATETIRASETGKMTIFATIYNLIICGYSIGANVYLLWKHNQIRMKPATKNKRTLLLNEFLWTIMILQSMAFIPFILKLNIDYIILYMPIMGQLFFVYVFFRMTYSMKLFENQDVSRSPAENAVKYAALKLDDRKVEDIRLQIIELMEKKKSYLNMDYTLSDMSKELKILPNLLSMVINSKLNCSFNEYINALRIKTAIELLNKAGKNNLTIEAIAYESGFNNRTSFYKAFKKQTGKLPKEYLQKEKELKEVV